MGNITIAGGAAEINLHGLRWVEEGEWAPVTTATRRTLDGALHARQQRVSGGQPLRLEGVCWVSVSTHAEILADVAAGGVRVLELYDGRL